MRSEIKGLYGERIQPHNKVWIAGINGNIRAQGQWMCVLLGRPVMTLYFLARILRDCVLSLIAMAVVLIASAIAEPLDVTIYESGGDGQVAECVLSKVVGLKSEGDGFLSVRSGPGSKYRKIDELYNGDHVLVYDAQGPWYGVLYDRGKKVLTSSAGCGFIGTGKRPLPYPGKKGWIHSNWLEIVAG